MTVVPGPEAETICPECQALPDDERRQLRARAMIRMLRDPER
jgi:hypothetical protein